MRNKQCATCGGKKPIEDYYKDKTHADGLASRCKQCMQYANHVQYMKNRDARLKKQKEYADERRDDIRGCSRQYYQQNCEKLIQDNLDYKKKNPEKVKRWGKAYGKRHRDRIRQHYKEYYRKNREKVTNKNRQWQIVNIEKWREYQNDYGKKRREKLEYRLIASIRSRIHRALMQAVKSKSTMEIIGCTVEQLKQHLESQFLPGMSWDNYGEWHIDHILPCSAFELQNSEEQEICFHYTNLQPLWAKDNISKGKKILVGGSL